MKNIMGNLFLLVIAIVVMVGFNSVYIVDETEQVVVTQFQKVVGEPVKKPGLKFKVPFIQRAITFPKNLLTWDGDPDQFPTKDKTYILVDTFARWRIQDPVKFFQAVATEKSAQNRLDEIIDPAVRNLIAEYPLVESVRNSDRALDTFEGTHDENQQGTQYKIDTGRDEITKQIVSQAKDKLLPFGIELMDVKIKRINYSQDVRESVYERMIAERKQIAEKYRAEGEGEAQNIKGEKEKELQVIRSEAYKTTQKIKGDADAQATQIYAKAYSADPEFYAFLKTMEVYKATMKEDSTLILSTDSDFMKYFKGIEKK